MASSYMTQELWSLAGTCVWNLPWLAIGVVGAVTFWRQKTARHWSLAAEIVGAWGTFALALLGWLVGLILYETGAPYSWGQNSKIIFSFLEFVSMAVFAVGYGWQKLGKTRGVRALPLK